MWHMWLSDPPGLNHKTDFFGSARGSLWGAPSHSEICLCLGGRGVRWFGVVRFGSAGFGGRKRAKIKMCVVVNVFFVVRRGSAGFGGRKKANKKIEMFAVVFLWFGLVRRGSVGFGGSKDTGGPSSQEEKPPHVAQHGHKKPILWSDPGGHNANYSMRRLGPCCQGLRRDCDPRCI